MKKKLACLDRTLKTEVPLLTFLQLKHDTFPGFLFTLLCIKLGAEVNEVVKSKSDKILLRTIPSPLSHFNRGGRLSKFSEK